MLAGKSNFEQAHKRLGTQIRKPYCYDGKWDLLSLKIGLTSIAYVLSMTSNLIGDWALFGSCCFHIRKTVTHDLTNKKLSFAASCFGGTKTLSLIESFLLLSHVGKEIFLASF